MSKQTLRAAVIGVGHLGRHHARILAGMDGVELVAVVDKDQEQGKAIATKCGSQWHAESAGLEQELDLAVIAVPTILHQDCAAPLLRAGVACLVEKPMAPDPATCDAIIADAKAGGALLGVGHVERFNPAVKRAMAKGIRPRFIEAHRLAPYTFRSTDVGVVLDLMIHDIDLALAWTGAEVTQVDAVGGATLSPSEDIVSARLHFSNGAVANLTASRLSLTPMRRFRVFGPDSYLSVDSQDRYALAVQKSSNFSPQAVEAAAASGNPLEGFRSLLDVEELELDDDEPLRAELEAFVAAVRGQREVAVSGEAGRNAVDVAFQIMAALEDCGWSDEQA
ncbi:MAG: Gfo/Idh/MocA family oxidoreductase [Planctomycetota bacterium]|jgi:predicted dehydrogenase|nr:Gfo/Idh/MocA family oxidoreductase [Planctomycetota bacterium]